MKEVDLSDKRELSADSALPLFNIPPGAAFSSYKARSFRRVLVGTKTELKREWILDLHSSG